MNILVVDGQKSVKELLEQRFTADSITQVARADDAIVQANMHRPDCIVLELGLAEHSGLEFLYEFRSYSDWIEIPCVVYTHIALVSDVLRSRSWQDLNVVKYLYKPDTNVDHLIQVIGQLRSGS